MTAPIVQGNAVRSRCTFRDVDASAVDPVTVVCKVKVPASTEMTYTYGVDAGLVRISPGVYQLWIATNTAAGTYTPRWKGTDADGNIVANESAFEVDASAFATP
jgi:hypothetical protein